MIVTDGLTNHYGKKRAVDGLSFSVTPGVVYRPQSAPCSW